MSIICTESRNSLNPNKIRDKLQRKFGIVSYNIYGNFTNCGSALQSWALHQAIDRQGQEAVPPGISLKAVSGQSGHPAGPPT